MKEILVINNAEPFVTGFAEPILTIIENARLPVKLTEYRDCPKTDFSGYSGIIMTGSPQGDDIVEHHLPYFEWIKNCKIPVLGICAGHHITGSLFGAELLRSEEPESGDFIVNIVHYDLIFRNMPEIFKVKQIHNDSISLPEDFILLATSETCKNQLMKHRTKNIYSCQFHPEFYNHDLLVNFLGICQ